MPEYSVLQISIRMAQSLLNQSFLEYANEKIAKRIFDEHFINQCLKSIILFSSQMAIPN